MIRDYGLWDSFLRNRVVRGDAVAFAFEEGAITHKGLVEDGLRYAAHLTRIGIVSGDRIAILCNGRPEMFLLLAAVARIGAILVPINWRQSVGEIGQILADCAPTLVLCEDEFRHLLPADDRRVASFDSLPASLADSSDPAGNDALPDEGRAVADAPVLILYTAALDGQARGAVLSQSNLIASAVQMQAAFGLGTGDCFLGALPFFHLMALALALAVNFAGGRTVVRSRYEANEAARLVESERISFIGTFPPMLDGLLDAAAAEGRNLASLRICTGLEKPETIQRFETLCPTAAFWSIYGQTEVSGNVTYGRYRDCPGSAGQTAILSHVAVVDEDDRPLPHGEAGEIVVQGPGVFQGYWRREGENAVIGRNAWHHTGDLGRFDEQGHLWYVGRAPHKELIKSGGENVYPGEVERVLRTHPALSRVVVLGVPDPEWGEAIVAVCELAGASTPNPDDLRSLVGDRLARYKRPKHFKFVGQLPEKDGQVDRLEVKARYGSEIGGD